MSGNIINMDQHKLLAELLKDLDEDEKILESYYYDYGVLMAITKMVNENIRYIYNYYYSDGKLVKDSVMIDIRLLDKVG